MSKAKKPRTETINCTVNASDGRITVSYDPKTGKMSIDGGENFFSERSYERSSKPKILSRMPGGKDGAYFDTINTLQENYDLLVAIDTNTRIVDDQTVSVTGIMIAQPVWVASRSDLPSKQWQYFCPFCIEFVGLLGEREKIGWSVALQRLEAANFISKSSRLGIVVDSSISEHKAMNTREIPFDGYNKLPKRWTLIYATSDSGKEDLLNQLISFADKCSSLVFAKLGGPEIPPIDGSCAREGFWSGMRIIENKKK